MSFLQAPYPLFSASRHQLLGIARAVKAMHSLSVVHGNLKIVCIFLPKNLSYVLTFFQTNVLVDAGGHARIAGLGATSISTTVLGVDVDKFFHGAAPELADPQRFRLTITGATTASDVYAFGILAWEVSRGT